MPQGQLRAGQISGGLAHPGKLEQQRRPGIVVLHLVLEAVVDPDQAPVVPLVAEVALQLLQCARVPPLQLRHAFIKRCHVPLRRMELQKRRSLGQVGRGLRRVGTVLSEPLVDL